jgi:hypothetical protein
MLQRRPNKPLRVDRGKGWRKMSGAWWINKSRITHAYAGHAGSGIGCQICHAAENEHKSDYQLHSEVRTLVDAIEAVEWSLGADDWGTGGRCPACQNRKSEGHAPDCKIAVALGREAAK